MFRGIAVPPEGGVAEPAVRDVYRRVAYDCKAPERTVSAQPLATALLPSTMLSTGIATAQNEFDGSGIDRTLFGDGPKGVVWSGTTGPSHSSPRAGNSSRTL